ncbi:oligopeptide/dipeptide ABC transporter, ATP-binding protein domain [Brucella abortus 78/32]|uniref:ABC transporter ATP-binding protein n=1 Tax=Brucella abortus TaxID=235 RepID=UPI0002CE2237|nr:ABC transporter ATP-binding protein [Brucella abortus]ENP40107.1 oligopeptide/dipeptide ABC transporter, ATP-binding protein domain [Brucella abortus 78/36]ENR87519.1 oligopeptide/dipeptide ABC transporter, ATP-binding protein domain [Brucella abortus 78/32]ENR89944.1 oligopeptide/dipeptide ABC transporter, ATP-binding protein domain [Brucella abortus 80/101]
MTVSLLQVQDLVKSFPSRHGTHPVRAVDGVPFTLSRGETLGLVGESGCGKSTLARLVLKLMPVSDGSISVEGHDVTSMPDSIFRDWRKRIQMIFQDPYSTLNPRHSLRRIFQEVFETHCIPIPEGIENRIMKLLADVGLGEVDLSKLPHEFSGGQLQRIGIAETLALDPDLIVADEPTSALDPSIQAQILNLMLKIRRERGVAFLLISHDLEVVGHLADRIAVMYLGRIVEEGPASEILTSPAHPYTMALLSASPTLADIRMGRDQRIRLRGDPPNPANVPDGCRFHPRCQHAMDICRRQDPQFTSIAEGRRCACHFWAEGGKAA